MKSPFAARFRCAFLVLLSASAASADGPAPRVPYVKPQRIELEAHHHQDMIRVKFTDDVTVRLRNGRLSDLGTGDLAPAAEALARLDGATWLRLYDVPADRLEQLRRSAEQRLGRAMPDLNGLFRVKLPTGLSAADAIDALNALDQVELALPCDIAPPPPLPPDFQPQQVYANGGPAGVGAEIVHVEFDIRGEGVRIVDIEYNWNANHVDLPVIGLIDVGSPLLDPFSSTHHGTATQGIMAGVENGYGITGIAPSATYSFAAVSTWEGGWDPGVAIIAATNVLEAGDIILIESQNFGPTDGFIAVEWDPFVYDAIVVAIGNGITVVEVVGNGGENLDAPIFSTGHFGHWPFLPENDSGAILVGAGAAPAPYGSTVDRSRLSFSNYGATVDLQGWGESVFTAGYGDAYSSGGLNNFFTAGFAGTSSAAPIVAGACALLQSAAINLIGRTLSPAEVRDLLRENGWPQQSGVFPASQNIGPRPDARLAIIDLLTSCDPTTDCDGNGIDDACEIADGSAADCNHNGVPDECDLASGVDDDCNDNGVLDDCEVATTFFAQSGELSPVGFEYPQSLTIDSPPAMTGDVVLSFTAHANLAQFFEVFNIEINGELVGQVFQTGASDCAVPPDEAALVVPLETAQALMNGEDALEIAVVPSGPVDALLCDEELSFVVIAVSYPIQPDADQDGDGVPDDCVPGPGTPGDLDDDGDVDFADLLALLAAWGECAQGEVCPADLDVSGGVGFADLLILLANWT